MMIIIIIVAIITKIVKFFLIINLHPLKIAIIMLWLQTKTNILTLLSEVRNLKNTIKLTITVTTAITIVIVKIMKTIAIIKVVLIIKLIQGSSI